MGFNSNRRKKRHELLHMKRDSGPTSGAFSLCQTFYLGGEPIPLNQKASTGGTVGVVVVTMRDIPEIDKLQTSFFCYLITGKECTGRCRLAVCHLIIRVKPGEMHRGICSEFFSNPLAKLCDFTEHHHLNQGSPDRSAQGESQVFSHVHRSEALVLISLYRLFYKTLHETLSHQYSSHPDTERSPLSGSSSIYPLVT